jgi:nucleoside-diphosphate-sugar epimerase
MDAVFHLAAVSRVAWGQEDPFKCWQTNQLGTLNVLEACRKAQTRPVMFYASSREVYGEPIYLPVNENHPKKPVSIYGMTKLSAERTCLSYSAISGLGQSVNYVTFRFSNVYGSTRDLPSRVIPKFMMKALRGEDITLYGGDQVLDFTFIDDTISGIMNAYTKSLDGHRELLGEDFHFVTGRGVSVADLDDCQHGRVLVQDNPDRRERFRGPQVHRRPPEISQAARLPTEGQARRRAENS